MDKSAQFRSVKPMPWMTRVASYAAILLIGVIIGFVPMWFRERAGAVDASAAVARADLSRSADTLAAQTVQQDLSISVLQTTLATAAIDAQRGDYESARQSASAFFTALRTEVDKGNDSALSPAQREGVQPLLDMRDEVITLLARNDPAAAARFSDLYVAFRDLVAG